MNDKNDRVLYVGSKDTPLKFKDYLLGHPKDVWDDGTVSREEGERLIRLWSEQRQGSFKLVSIYSINCIIKDQPQQPVVIKGQVESSNNMKMNISREKLITAIQASIDAKQTQFETDSAKYQNTLSEAKSVAKNFGLVDGELKTAADKIMTVLGSFEPIIPSEVRAAKTQLAKLNLSTDENIELDAADAFLSYIQ